MSFRRARLPLGPGSSEGSLWGGGVHRAGLQEAVSAKIPVSGEAVSTEAPVDVMGPLAQAWAPDPPSLALGLWLLDAGCPGGGSNLK